MADPNQNNNDGYVPGYWQRARDYFNDTVDEQALFRLKECREVEAIRNQCREGKYDPNGPTPLASCYSGMRILSYYRIKDVDNVEIVPCSREEHAVWNCRALALKCGGEMVNVRNCFLDLNKVTNGTKVMLTTPTHESYDSDPVGPCANFQKALGNCVKQNAVSLAERRKKREERERRAAVAGS